jgi:hypothetical protein
MFARVVAPCVLALLIGCGSGGSPRLDESGPGTPHGGELIPMPGGKGFVEIVAKGKGASFYFLKDASTPFSPAPTAGVLNVGSKKITLKSEGEGLAVPDGTAAFVKGTADGILSVELDGKPVNIPLSAAR